VAVISDNDIPIIAESITTFIAKPNQIANSGGIITTFMILIFSDIIMFLPQIAKSRYLIIFISIDLVYICHVIKLFEDQLFNKSNCKN
jgi:hypothetical protein